MKFLKITGGFATPFSLKPISNGGKYQAIVEHLYDYLTIDELKDMNINLKNYLQV